MFADQYFQRSNTWLGSREKNKTPELYSTSSPLKTGYRFAHGHSLIAHAIPCRSARSKAKSSRPATTVSRSRNSVTSNGDTSYIRDFTSIVEVAAPPARGSAAPDETSSPTRSTAPASDPSC